MDRRILRELTVCFVAGAWCQLLLVRTTSTLSANLLIKRYNVVLGKLKDNISFKSFMDLRNVSLSGA